MDFITAHPSLLWFLFGIALLVLEALTPTFFLAFFGVGALITAVAAYAMPTAYEAQALTFLVASLGGMLALRRKMRLFFRGYMAKTDNLDDPVISGRYIGRDVEVLQEVTPGKRGLVELDGTNWQARTDGPAIAEGERVRITAVDGLTLVIARPDAASTDQNEK